LRRSWTLLSSSALDFELAQIPDPQRRIRVQQMSSAAWERIAIGGAERTHANHLRQTYRLRALDSLHLACAKSMLADVFLTTDDGLLAASRRIPTREFPFVIANPMTWLTEILARE